MPSHPPSRPGTGGSRSRQLGALSSPATVNDSSSRSNVVSPPLQWQNDIDSAPPVPYFIGRRRHFLPATNMKPVDVVQRFLDDEFFDEVVAETNRYASQCLKGITRKRSGMADWKPVDGAEMKKFFGLLFMMGLNQRPSIKHFWSTHRLWASFYRKVMSRNRFEDILRYLHVVDNRSSQDSSATQDPLWKLRPFVDRLLSRFKTSFEPGKELSLDEGTCPFKGRVSFRTYNPRKPHKWGLKLYEVCDSATGYCLAFKIASGESSSVKGIVVELMENYLYKGHELYVDRYYTSIPLFQELYAKYTLAVGTCQITRRGMPKTFLDQNIPRGDVLACRQGPILALKWRDRRDVVVLSTKHTSEMTTVSVRVRGGRVLRKKPVAVVGYNKHMGGVDNSDQMLGYYSFNRKGVKWWKKLYFHLISLALVNAHKLYNMQNERNNQSMPLCDFLAAIDDLIGSSPRFLVEGVSPSPIQASNQHFPERTEATTSKRHAQLKCKVCAKKRKLALQEDPPRKIRSATTTARCKQCKVPLCIFGCFEAYHTKENYWE